MKDETRRDLLANVERLARVNAFLLDGPEPIGDLGEVLLDARLDAADSQTALGSPAFQSTWLVRLSGPSVTDGWVDSEMQRRILIPLEREVEAAAGKAAAEARIGLVGVSSGSVILHYRPLKPTRGPNESQVDFDVSPVDAAVQKVSLLHDMFERQVNQAEIASAFKKEAELLTHARTLVESLSAQNIDLSTRWWTAQGGRSVSRLGQGGRAYALSLFERTSKGKNERISGIVTGLDLEGEIAIARAANGRWHVVADADTVRSPRLVLGETVHLIVRREQEIDRVGVKGKERLFFVAFDDGPAPLDEPGE